MIKKLYYYLKTIPRLGIRNVGYMIWYRLSMKIGLRKKMFDIEKPVNGIFFEAGAINEHVPIEWKKKSLDKAEDILKGKFTYFSFHTFYLTNVPDWFFNPFDDINHPQQKLHWTEISDFNHGDIKIIWELSRYDWLIDLVKAYKISGNEKYISQANLLLNDWSNRNPLNQGPNWKCGQETSFRLMKLLTSAFLLDQFSKPGKLLLDFVFQHVKRIEGNINYGIAQDNNHGSSEAIALYIGAAWLIKNGYQNTDLHKWKTKGRSLLEGRIKKLIQKQGSFSQRSMNYHRVMVDTMSFCLHMMKLLNENSFNDSLMNRLIALGEWQYKMTFGIDGDAPNYGSNDGARIENLYSNDYRDFRPSTQLYFALLTKQRVYDDINVSEAMYWRCGKEALNYAINKINLPAAEILDNHILLMRNEKANLFLKIPDVTFRPGNDPFHVDLWIDGQPVLIDSGTFSYHKTDLTDKFKSINAHNTIQFGNKEPMPKLSRFLNGEWIKAGSIGQIESDNGRLTWKGSYVDCRKNYHQREIVLSQNDIEIYDRTISNESIFCHFHFNELFDIKDFRTDKKEASLYYLEKHQINFITLKRLIKFDSRKVKTDLKVKIDFNGSIEYTFLNNDGTL